MFGDFRSAKLVKIETTHRIYKLVTRSVQYTLPSLQVTFPATVQWMVVEFDPLCATAQPEDNLGVYIPTRKRPPSPEGSTGSRRRASEDELPQDSVWTLVMKKFHGGTNWPQMAVILPGMSSSSFAAPSGMTISRPCSTSHQFSLPSAILVSPYDFFHTSVHFAMLPLYDVFGLPRRRFPITFPWITHFTSSH